MLKRKKLAWSQRETAASHWGFELGREHEMVAPDHVAEENCASYLA